MNESIHMKLATGVALLGKWYHSLMEAVCWSMPQLYFTIFFGNTKTVDPISMCHCNYFGSRMQSQRLCFSFMQKKYTLSALSHYIAAKHFPSNIERSGRCKVVMKSANKCVFSEFMKHTVLLLRNSLELILLETLKISTEHRKVAKSKHSKVVNLCYTL